MKKSKKIFFIVLAVILIVIAALPVLLNAETETLNSETRSEAPGKFIELSQGYTHYQEAGPDSAQTVLLVHGFSVPYYIWDPTFDALEKSGFHVIRFDLYGRGYSDRPRTEYNQALFTRQISDLLAALNIHDTIDIIGVSMGGPITTSFTVENPDKINKLVLIDPVHEAVNVPILKIPLLNKYLINVVWAPSLISKQLNDFYHPELFEDWPDKFASQMQYKGFKSALFSTLQHYMSVDKLSEYTALGKLNKPALLIWGMNDKTVPYEGNERIRQVMECEFLSVSESGHIPHYEHPEVVTPRIIEFLNN